MLFFASLLITGLTLSSVAIYYSVLGLVSIFSTTPIPIYIMGTTLEVAKLVGASWLKHNWVKIPIVIKTYMLLAIIILMLITSVGCFGYLARSHADQHVSTETVSGSLQVIEEKIKIQRENLDAARKSLVQLDSAVNETMGRSTSQKGAEKSIAVRRGQQKERGILQSEVIRAQQEIQKLNEEKLPLLINSKKNEAEVGPIKYLAKLFYGDKVTNDILDSAITYMIIAIVAVFDPLAIIMLLSAQMTYGWIPKKNKQQLYDQDYKEPIQTSLSTIEKNINNIAELSELTNEIDSNTVVSNENVTYNISPIDQMYVEYANSKFNDITANKDEDLEFYNFIEESKIKPRFNNYSKEKLSHFLQKIYDTRKNNNNITTR